MRLQPSNKFSQWELEELTHDRAHGYKISSVPLKTRKARRINWRYNIALFVMIAAFILIPLAVGGCIERWV